MADAEQLSAFAAECFSRTFSADNDPDDMAAYMCQAFGVGQQRAELADPGTVTLLAESGGRLAGYAQTSARRTLECVTGAAPMELMRFYVAVEWQGQGVAAVLMQEVLATARRAGADVLWLCVWERNPRAVAFYRKWSFVPAGSAPFQLGRDHQTDLVMVRRLDPES